MYIIGIDLGGTKIEAIFVKDNILQPIKKKRIPTEREKGYDAYFLSISQFSTKTSKGLVFSLCFRL